MVRRVTLWFALLCAAGLLWGGTACSGSAGTDSGTRSANATAVPSPRMPPASPPIANTATTDGGVAMSIAGVDCARKSAIGNNCYVTYHVVNVSDGFPVFTEADQLAYGASGRAFHADPAADALANHGTPVTQRLQRGLPVTGILVFDIPAGDRIDRLVLHGKPGTPGEVFPLS